MSTIVELKREIAFLQAENRAFADYIDRLQAENKKLKADPDNFAAKRRFEAATAKLLEQVR